MCTNNATKGITIQKAICDIYNLDINNNAKLQFRKNISSNYYVKAKQISLKIFKLLNDEPINFITFNTKSKPPYNFKLKSGKTLSIRTNKSGDKVAPRVVGQAGYETLNNFFGDLVDYDIKDKNSIKKLVIENIHKMLPTFMDYFLYSDYTIWINENDDIKLITRDEAPNMIFNRSDIQLTRDTIETWNESTTVKFKNQSFAEIQVHKNRTFKFRFIMSKICEWLKELKINNETLGMTAEKTICTVFNIKGDKTLEYRSNKTIERDLTPIVIDAFKYLPKAIKHTGSIKGIRGGNSKCSYDFILQGNKTLSLKTNYGNMVCPPEVGQPGDKTFLLYFGTILNINIINNDIFKKSVFNNIQDMMPIYLEHLLDSDYLLWIYKKHNEFAYKIINSDNYRDFRWEKDKFSFTRANENVWNSSNTVKYKGLSIGEFQVHLNRNCYKFRFNMKNLLKLFKNYYETDLNIKIAESSTKLINSK